MVTKLSPTIFLTLCTFITASEWKIELEYSLDDFKTVNTLGRIDLRKNFDGNFTGSFKSSGDASFGKKLLGARDSTYSVRAKSSTQPGNSFLTTSDPCLLIQSNLFHLFWISIDQQNHVVQSITVFPDSVAFNKDDKSIPNWNSKLSCDQKMTGINPGLDERIGDGTAKGVVQVVGTTQLPTPDTASFVQRMEKEKRSRQHAAEGDNRSFLAKYWMYIVPVVLFAVVSNLVNPENQEGGGAAQ